MPFDLEWTGRSYGNDDDHNRAIEAAKGYCEQQGIDPAEAWREFCAKIEASEDIVCETWNCIEYEALKGLGWDDLPENVSLIYR